MSLPFNSLAHMLEQGNVLQVRQLFAELTAQEQERAAGLALALGRPTLALDWSRDPLTRAAAQLRLGRAHEALNTLQAEPATARPAALRARAQWQLGQLTLEGSLAVLHLARQEGDAGAIIALATLRGEQQLHAPFAALRSLAEGLKVAELTGHSADPHLLAVLAHAQLRAGGLSKGTRSAEKALERSAPCSPACLIALLALRRPDEAQATAQAGELGEVWARPFS
ncbi:hypothetical protein [Deinococcus sp.]|uniref:hypothetical protein n=1 Tax=Deinococcus sp. TaxID=47478 RepID=UPI0025BEBBB7|nr:hypothetical protein [Deinococcus sp.]